jgi:hypothetical protein
MCSHHNRFIAPYFEREITQARGPEATEAHERAEGGGPCQPNPQAAVECTNILANLTCEFNMQNVALVFFRKAVFKNGTMSVEL